MHNALDKRVYREQFDQVALLKILSQPAIPIERKTILLFKLTNYLSRSKNGEEFCVTWKRATRYHTKTMLLGA